jgi:hypothetical protein
MRLLGELIEVLERFYSLNLLVVFIYVGKQVGLLVLNLFLALVESFKPEPRTRLTAAR